MRKAIRAAVALAGVLVLLLILATMSLRLMFPAARLRALIQAQVRSLLNRDIQFGGIQIGLGGLRLTRFRLSEVPSFAEGTFLAVEGAEVRWALRPFFSKQVRIKTLLLERPEVQLIRFERNRLNVADLAGAVRGRTGTASGGTGSAQDSTPAQTQAPKSGNPWSWNVEQIELRDGLIHYNDRSSSRQTSALTGIHLVLRDFDPTRMKGRLTIQHIDNPVYVAHAFMAEWSLEDIDPSLSRVSGWLRMTQGAGSIQHADKLADASASARLALMPLAIVQNLDQSGIVRLGLPDFSPLQISHAEGDYAFRQGTLTIHKFQMGGPQLNASMAGTAVLPRGKLNVSLHIGTPKTAHSGALELDLTIGGTLDKPKTDLRSLRKQAFRATLKNVLHDPETAKTLKKLFH